MLEFAISILESLRSFLMVTLIYNFMSVPQLLHLRFIVLTNGGKAYHDQNAIMKPNQEKKNTRP